MYVCIYVYTYIDAIYIYIYRSAMPRLEGMCDGAALLVSAIAPHTSYMYTYTYTYICMYICICVYVYMNIYTYIHEYLY